MIHTIVAVGKSTKSVMTPTRTAPIVAPMSGMRSNSAMSSASAPANGTPRMRQHDPRGDAGDRRLDEHAGDVARDRRGDAVARTAHRLPADGVLLGEERRAPAWPAAEHEDAEDEDRHEGEDAAHQARADVAEDARGVAEALRAAAGLLLEAAR